LDQDAKKILRGVISQNNGFLSRKLKYSLIVPLFMSERNGLFKKRHGFMGDITNLALGIVGLVFVLAIGGILLTQLLQTSGNVTGANSVSSNLTSQGLTQFATFGSYLPLIIGVGIIIVVFAWALLRFSGFMNQGR